MSSGGWKSSTRRSRLPKDWPKITARVAKRDDYICQWPMEYAEGGKPAICGKPYRDVDHKRNPHDHSDAALWSLCSTHHDRKTQKEAAAGRSRAKSRSTAWP